MALNPVAARREPSGEVRDYPAEPDGLRRSATVNSIGLSAIRTCDFNSSEVKWRSCAETRKRFKFEYASTNALGQISNECCD